MQSASSKASLSAAAVPPQSWNSAALAALQSEVEDSQQQPETVPVVSIAGSSSSGMMSTNGTVIAERLQLNVSLRNAEAPTPGVHLFELLVYKQTSGVQLTKVVVPVLLAVPQLGVSPNSVRHLVRPADSSMTSDSRTRLSIANSGNAALSWSARLLEAPCWLALLPVQGQTACGSGPSDACVRGTLPADFTDSLILSINTHLLQAGQHQADVQIDSSAGHMTVPVVVVVTAVSVCPSELRITGLAPPSSMRLGESQLDVHASVAISNVGEAPLRVLSVHGISATPDEVASALQPSLEVCGSRGNRSSTIETALRELTAVSGKPDWLFGIVSTPGSAIDADVQSSAASAANVLVLENSRDIMVGSTGELNLGIRQNVSTSLGRSLGSVSASVVVLLLDLARNSTEARVVSVELESVAGSHSAATSLVVLTSNQLSAAQRPLITDQTATLVGSAATRVALVALKDALGRPRPAGHDALNALLSNDEGDALHQPCAPYDTLALGLTRGQVRAFELQHEAATQVLQSLDRSMPHLDTLTAHLEGGGSLHSVHVEAQNSRPMTFVLQAESIPISRGLHAASPISAVLTGDTRCRGNAGYAVPGALDLSKVGLGPGELLPISQGASSLRRRLVPTRLVARVTTEPANCSAPNTVQDPANGLTCTCWPGYARDPEVPAADVTSETLRCLACPAGTARRGGTLRSLEEEGACSPCPDGTFSLAGWHSCASCPRHMQCAGGLVFVAAGHALLDAASASAFARGLVDTHAGTGPGSGLDPVADAQGLAQPPPVDFTAKATRCPNPFACTVGGQINVSAATGVLRRTTCAPGHDAASDLCADCLPGFEHDPPAAGSSGACTLCPTQSAAASKVAMLVLVSVSVYVLVLVSWFHPKHGPGLLPPALIVFQKRGSMDVKEARSTRFRRASLASQRRPSAVAIDATNPMLSGSSRPRSKQDSMERSHQLFIHPTSPGLLWSVAGPHMQVTKRESAQILEPQVRMRVRGGAPKWVLSWDSVNREVPTGPYHALYDSMIQTGRREMPLPFVPAAPPPMDAALRTFSGVALFMFLQLSARLAETRLGTNAYSSSTSAVPHMAALFPISSLDAACLFGGALRGYSRFTAGIVMAFAAIPAAALIAAIAGGILCLLRSAPARAEKALGKRTDPRSRRASVPGASLKTVTQSWLASLEAPEQPSVAHLVLAALALLLPGVLPESISIMTTAVLNTTPNGRGGTNLLSDFSRPIGSTEHAAYVAAALSTSLLLVCLPVAGVVTCHSVCSGEMSRRAMRQVALVGGGASSQAPFPPSSFWQAGKTHVCSSVVVGSAWRVGGLLWGWVRPTAWWWHLLVFAMSCCLALVQGSVNSIWGRMYVADLVLLTLWLLFEWIRPYASHRVVGAPRFIAPHAPRLVLPPHLLVSSLDSRSEAPAPEPSSIEPGVHAAGQRAARALLGVEARLRTRLARLLLVLLALQAGLAHMAFVWQLSLFAGPAGSADAAEATGTPPGSLQDSLVGSASPESLRAAVFAFSWLHWIALWVGIISCFAMMLPAQARALVLHGLAGLGSAAFWISGGMMDMVDQSTLRQKQRRMRTASMAVRDDSRKEVKPLSGQEAIPERAQPRPGVTPRTRRRSSIHMSNPMLSAKPSQTGAGGGEHSLGEISDPEGQSEPGRKAGVDGKVQGENPAFKHRAALATRGRLTTLAMQELPQQAHANPKDYQQRAANSARKLIRPSMFFGQRISFAGAVGGARHKPRTGSTSSMPSLDGAVVPVFNPMLQARSGSVRSVGVASLLRASNARAASTVNSAAPRRAHSSSTRSRLRTAKMGLGSRRAQHRRPQL